jgi:hypothetical protein
MIYNAVRLRQISLLELIDVAMSVSDKLAQEQFKVIFQKMQTYAPAYINTAFSIWLEAITDELLNVSSLLIEMNNPLHIHFSSGITTKLIKVVLYKYKSIRNSYKNISQLHYVSSKK